MNFSPKLHPKCSEQAFSLIEMLAVVAILMILMAAGIRLGDRTASASRRSATDVICGLVERARATAIGRRTSVLLAFASPADLPNGNDGRYRVGLFQILSDGRGVEWLTDRSKQNALPLGSWKVLDRGLVIGSGGEAGLLNPMDEPVMAIRVAGAGVIRVHGIILGPHGGLHWPIGSTPAVIRIAEGNFEQGRIEVHQNSDDIAENLLRIGRHTARAYQIDR